MAIGTLIATVVGLSLVAWQLREQRRAMRAELGNLYVQRYWLIDDDLLLTPKGSDLHLRHRHRYLRLFEDEFDVAALGFLDLQQWEAWHGVLTDPRTLNQVTADLADCNEAGDLFLRLRACVAQRDREGGPHDAARCYGGHKR